MSEWKTREFKPVECKRCGTTFWTGEDAKLCQSCVDSTARVKAKNRRRKREAAGQAALWRPVDAANNN